MLAPGWRRPAVRTMGRWPGALGNGAAAPFPSLSGRHSAQGLCREGPPLCQDSTKGPFRPVPPAGRGPPAWWKPAVGWICDPAASRKSAADARASGNQASVYGRPGPATLSLLPCSLCWQQPGKPCSSCSSHMLVAEQSCCRPERQGGGQSLPGSCLVLVQGGLDLNPPYDPALGPVVEKLLWSLVSIHQPPGLGKELSPPSSPPRPYLASAGGPSPAMAWLCGPPCSPGKTAWLMRLSRL